MRRAEGRTRSVLRERLEARREEIEEATLARVYAIADPGEAPDPEYLEGLRGSVAIALNYALEILESSADNPPPVPVALLAQARLAARNGVTLDAVLRRYFAGYSLLGYFLIEEAAKDGLLSGGDLQRLVGTQAGLFDRFLKAIGEEHAREWESRGAPLGGRQAERIEQLLAGEPIDTSDIAYDFEGWHLGVAASGPGVTACIRELAHGLEARSLIVERGGTESVWAWFGRGDGGKRVEDLRLPAGSPDGIRLAVGEAGEGLAGWRLTHRQAVATMTVAQTGPDRLVRYADVALVASVLQDDLLSISLRRLFLEPLSRERDGGESLRATLRAYLAASGSLSSAGTMLGVSRRTVGNRLRRVEELIGRPLHAVTVEIDAALRIESLTPGRKNLPNW